MVVTVKKPNHALRRDVTGKPCARSTRIAYIIRLHDDSSVATWSPAVSLSPRTRRLITMTVISDKIEMIWLSVIFVTGLTHNCLRSAVRGHFAVPRTLTNDCWLKGIFFRWPSAWNRVLHMCFVDFEKAFDKVNHSKLWWTMVDMGFASHLVALIRSLYDNQHSKVKIHGETSGWFTAKQGVRQGCILWSYLRTSSIW